MYNPDEHQKAVINLYGTNALVLAAPGCGKTEILSQRIIKAHWKSRHLHTEDSVPWIGRLSIW